MIRIKHVFQVLVAAVFMFSFFSPCFAATPKLYEKLGGKNIDILKNAKFVKMLVISPNSKKGPLDEIHLTSEQMERLKKNLLDDHNYDFSKPKYCHFNPELSFKFQTDNDALHLIVNLNCNQILFVTGDQSVLLNYNPVEQRLGHFFNELITEGYQKNKKANAHAFR